LLQEVANVVRSFFIKTTSDPVSPNNIGIGITGVTVCRTGIFERLEEGQIGGGAYVILIGRHLTEEI
jgi:hypothetical protein